VPKMTQDIYNELLHAMISELESMKRRGQRYITVAPDTIKSLSTRTTGSTAETPRSSRPVAPQLSRQSPTPPPIPPAKPIAPATPVARTREPDIVISSDAGKVAAFQELRDRALVCQKCPNLVTARRNVVFGVGNLDAELMF